MYLLYADVNPINVMEPGDDYLQGIVPLLESSTIAENDVLVKSVNAELGN
jgi:hypothetical protein